MSNEWKNNGSRIIDIMNGKTMYLVSSSKPDPNPPFPSSEYKYQFFVKASSVASAHKFAQKHLGPGVSFSTRKTSGIEQVIPDAEIYEAE
jgi:hypothetical protein